MDKKFMGIIAGMLVMCIVTIILASAALKTGDTTSATLGSTYSALYVKQIFDRNKVQEIRITLAETDFNDMMQNPTKEEYKNAVVTVNGEKVENVGFRVKGNSSLNSVARTDSKRFSFKLDFDQYVDGQSLDGLTKLNLNNSFSDSSYMREYLSYSLLDEMGVPTPAYSYTNVYVNGELIGLYLAVEGIEEPFLARIYGSNYGNLYKPEGSGSDLVYVDDNMNSYSGITPVFDVKDGANEALLTMLKALNQGKELDKYLNVDEILRYFAVNTALVNMDSYQGSFKHNYYLYEKNGVFSILPWDYNMSFGGFSMGRGTGGSSTSLYIDQPVSGTTMEKTPLLAKLLEVPEYKQLYHQYIKEFINGPFSEDKMQAEIARVASMIRPYVEKDPTKFTTMEQFEAAIAEGAQAQNSTIQDEESNKIKADAQTTGNSGGNQVKPTQQDPADNGKQPGGMMPGNTSTGLIKFVRDRIDNVNKQLNGEIPSSGSTSEQSDNNMMPGQQNDGQNRSVRPGDMPPNADGEPPNADMARQGRPDFNRGPGGGPGMGPDGARDNARGSRIQNISTQELYLVGGALALLILMTLLVLKRKTKHSINKKP
ncbi:MAG: CotH kinase family protein [Syntrophomonas sp.]